MRTLGFGFGFALIAAGCTSSSPDASKVPGASLTPRADTAAAVACGDSVAWYGDASPDLVYSFTYNAADELVHANGVFAAGGANDVIDYTWDAAGNFTGMTEGDGSYQNTITAAYDTTNGMTDYATSYTSADYNDGWDYAMSNFIAPWQPGREVITETGQAPFGYTLAYDADGRLTSAVPDSGAPTTYTYDDAARTVTIDTGAGAWHGVITYDADNNELSEVWGGSDPSAIASSTVYAWSGDALQSSTYSSGSQADPKALSVVEVDTMQYSCAAAAHVGTGHAVRPGIARPGVTLR
jgi:YD repeat-containing protein